MSKLEKLFPGLDVHHLPTAFMIVGAPYSTHFGALLEDYGKHSMQAYGERYCHKILNAEKEHVGTMIFLQRTSVLTPEIEETVCGVLRTEREANRRVMLVVDEVISYSKLHRCLQEVEYAIGVHPLLTGGLVVEALKVRGNKDIKVGSLHHIPTEA